MIQPIGFYKIHRALFHKPIWLKSTAEQKVVLMTLIAMAWFKPNEWEWKGEKFKTEQGQFVTSLQSIVDSCGNGISIQNVRSSLKRFEKLEFLTDKSTKEGRLITIANWDLYQSDDDNPTKLPTKTQQRPNKDPTPKEEGKKEIKKDNKDIIDFFNECWLMYPKKEGKGSISDTKKKELYKLGDEFKNCIKSYIIAKKGIDKQYIQKGSTFFNSGYIDYLNSEQVKVEPRTRPQKVGSIKL